MGKLIIGDLSVSKPIIQGGMGVGISLSSLAGTVAANGGIGLISTAQIGYRKKIFEKNPFTIIIDDATHSKIYNELKTIRNQVAHDSDESRMKFFKDCLFSRQSDENLGVNEYLKRNTSRTITQSNYSRLVEGVIDIITFIDNPFFT